MKEQIIDFLTQERKMKIINEGKSPYWMYNIGNKSEDYDNNDYVITIWFGGSTPANIEIYENTEGKCYFNGHIYNLSDLKIVLYLIFDCISENEYLDTPKDNQAFVICIQTELGECYLGQQDSVVSKIRSAVFYHDDVYAKSELDRVIRRYIDYPLFNDSSKLSIKMVEINKS